MLARPICYLKTKGSLGGKDITITARLKVGKRSMKAVDYRHNVSTDHRGHHGDGAMPDERNRKQAWESG